jgi:alkyl hydroperoxide reductase subunit AhpF
VGVEQLMTGQSEQPSLAIYVSMHCPVCEYAFEVAAIIRHNFSKVQVCLIDIHGMQEIIPEAVFATPTYLLNGRLWSLGNPSLEKIYETFQNFV